MTTAHHPRTCLLTRGIGPRARWRAVSWHAQVRGGGGAKEAANALKYATALCVVFTSAATRWDRARAQSWRTAWLASLVV